MQLHPRDNGRHRPVQLLVDPDHLLLDQPPLECPPEPEGDQGILGGIRDRLLDRDPREADPALAGAGERIVADRVVVQMALGKFVHAVAVLGAIQDVADQQRVVVGRDRDLVLVEHADVVLQVVPDLEDGRILQDRPETIQHRVGFKLAIAALPKGIFVAERHVDALVLVKRHG